MSASRTPAERERAFCDLYEDAYDEVLRFVRRRVGPESAEDVVADAMTVAWRRFDEMPPGRDGARAWVFGVARNTMLNARRGDRRQAALGVRVADAARRDHGSVAQDPVPGERLDAVSGAFQGLSEKHQEALALSVWDELGSAEAARVLQISPVAFRVRLTRARRALRTALAGIEEQPRVGRTERSHA